MIRISGRPLLLITVALFASALAFQWNGAQSVAVADSVGYIVSGTNLVRFGDYRNPFGEPETWFPPLYPFLIGLGSLCAAIDPLLVARLLSALSSLICILLVWFFMRGPLRLGSFAAFLGTLVLICNPCFQLLANFALSEAVATTFCLASLLCWARPIPGSPLARSGYLGLLIGLAYLARPEGILLFALFGTIDFFQFGFHHIFRRYAITGVVLALTVVPYAIFLHQQTGTWSLSGKGDVNLATGRSQYYGVPREYIDPVTLQMRFYSTRLSLESEAKRYCFNLVKVGNGYLAIYRWPFGLVLLGVAGFGAWRLAQQGERRLLLGLLAQFAYVAVLAVFAVTDRYLHATLPALSICAGYGLAELFRVAANPRLGATSRSVLAFVLLVAGLALAEEWSRYPRWALTGSAPGMTMSREAGLRIAAAGFPHGTMYEDGATVGYYAGHRRGRITPNDLDTVTRYIHRHHRNDPEPVYVAISTFGTYHPSVAALVNHELDPYRPILTLEDRHGKIVIYQVTIPAVSAD